MIRHAPAEDDSLRVSIDLDWRYTFQALPCGRMRFIIPAVLATAPVVLASQNVFSVHDDVLAFPQYEIIFSDKFISDKEASLIVEEASSHSATPLPELNSKAIDSTNHDRPHPTSTPYAFDPLHETYEFMYLKGEQHFCTIPIVITPPRNETSEAEARAAEQKELARATNRGWELLQGMEGNCLSFVSGWWSYLFCYNAEITQFHQLPPTPGQPPKPDPQTPQYVLGRANGKPSKHDEWGNEIELHKGKNAPPKTELQVKGDTRYLVQKLEGGTICDLTGKPRRVEVQYHCNPHSIDRIGYIKEITTCSYLLVIYTARLCTDIAFMPPKEAKANPITCRVIVPEDELDARYEAQSLDHELAAAEPKDLRPTVGGLVVGAGKWMNKDGARMPIPADFGKTAKGSSRTTIVRAKPKSEGGKIESLSDADMLKLNVDPKQVEGLKDEIKRAAQNRGWKIEVVEDSGEMISVVATIDEADTKQAEEQADNGEGGSEETFKDEL